MLKFQLVGVSIPNTLKTNSDGELIREGLHSHFPWPDNSRVNPQLFPTPLQPVLLTLEKDGAVYILVESSYYQFAH